MPDKCWISAGILRWTDITAETRAGETERDTGEHAVQDVADRQADTLDIRHRRLAPCPGLGGEPGFSVAP